MLDAARAPAAASVAYNCGPSARLTAATTAGSGCDASSRNQSLVIRLSGLRSALSVRVLAQPSGMPSLFGTGLGQPSPAPADAGHSPDPRPFTAIPARPKHHDRYNGIAEQT